MPRAALLPPVRPPRRPCIPEGSESVFGLAQGLPWLSARSRGVDGGSVDGHGYYQTRKREIGAQGCSPPPSTPASRANARAVCMEQPWGRRAYWGSRAAWGVTLPSNGYLLPISNHRSPQEPPRTTAESQGRRLARQTKPIIAFRLRTVITVFSLRKPPAVL